ncbi:Mth938-like domain-containing protein [Kaarinaea lacus]
MRFTPDKDFGSYTVRSYEAGQVNIILPMEPGEETPQDNQRTLTRSFIISPKYLKENWPPQNLSAITEEHLQAAIDLNPELIILGTGKILEFPQPSVTESLFAKGIGVEIMDTAAACRTYNVLMHEGRDVVAALIVN